MKVWVQVLDCLHMENKLTVITTLKEYAFAMGYFHDIENLSFKDREGKLLKLNHEYGLFPKFWKPGKYKITIERLDE